MKTIHLVYPHGQRISTPDAIGRNLGQRLAEHYQVIYYDWDSFQTIKPDPHDILLGHPNPLPWTIFRRSCQQTWQRVIALCPYNHGDNGVLTAYLNPILPYCDLYLAITGIYWFSEVSHSLYAHWLPKMKHLDLAVDRTDFPVLKTTFAETGKRKFIYIGHKLPCKNTTYLTEIARLMPETQISWVGGKNYEKLSGVVSLGLQDFATESGKNLINSNDFLITVGSADANPTTILEAMAWGLIPVCTPQSGYVDYPGIINVPLNDAPKAVEILRNLQALPESRLKEMQQINWQILDTHFNWDRFAQQVIEAIESKENHPLLPISQKHRLYIRLLELTSPYSSVPSYLLFGVKILLRRIKNAL